MPVKSDKLECVTHADRSNTHTTILIPLGKCAAVVSPGRARACDTTNLQLPRLCRRYTPMLERLDGSTTFLSTAAGIYRYNRVVLMRKTSKQTPFAEHHRSVFQDNSFLKLNGCQPCARTYVAHQ